MNNKRIFLMLILIVIFGSGLIGIRHFNHDTECLTFVGKEEGYHESISFNNSFKFDKSLGDYVEYKVEI